MAGVAVLLAAQSAAADEKFKLDDAALERVTAGTQESGEEIARFDFSRTTASGRTVSGDGSLVMADRARDYTLFLGDNAQGNLRSLVNINAVNSTITVLLNLNISIDSSIGTINQLNLQSTVPVVPPGTK
jgi:hypothetical protein